MSIIFYVFPKLSSNKNKHKEEEVIKGQGVGTSMVMTVAPPFIVIGSWCADLHWCTFLEGSFAVMTSSELGLLPFEGASDGQMVLPSGSQGWSSGGTRVEASG